VPGSEAAKIAKALACDADEVVVDLEDSVAMGAKDHAREALADLSPRERGSIAVRVNAPSTRWHTLDLEACVRNHAVGSIVVPKVESPRDVLAAAEHIQVVEHSLHRGPVTLQALIESPAALTNISAIAVASPRLVSLIIGYADLSASMGRRLDASWQFAQDLVFLAARTAGIQAIDGPHLTVADDSGFATAVESASALGFDGKWVIHPRQVTRVQAGFTPLPEEVAEAREILAAMAEASRAGEGAVAWRGRMLDEALVVAARRVLGRAEDA
jgi:citrate lyase subunit beta/citryl-CoA lyase